MPQKQRRFTLKTKEAKQVLSEAAKKLKLDAEATFGSKANLEVSESEVGSIYLLDGKPLLYKTQTQPVMPMLTFAEFIAQAPKITVDMGAVPFVCKGAAVMAPGIRHVEGNFNVGDIVSIIDEKHGKTLALGEALYDAETVRNTKKGPVVKSFHWVGDKIWDFAKDLTE
jgi:PUA-domain protein